MFEDSTLAELLAAVAKTERSASGGGPGSRGPSPPGAGAGAGGRGSPAGSALSGASMLSALGAHKVGCGGRVQRAQRSQHGWAVDAAASMSKSRPSSHSAEQSAWVPC